jgi:hypothetical protein
MEFSASGFQFSVFSFRFSVFGARVPVEPIAETPTTENRKPKTVLIVADSCTRCQRNLPILPHDSAQGGEDTRFTQTLRLVGTADILARSGRTVKNAKSGNFADSRSHAPRGNEGTGGDFADFPKFALRRFR